jgi:predicted HTH transcriptional regulator
MPRTEQLVLDTKQVSVLRKLVSAGEGQHLEFKRKAAFPDKVVRELIAFANSGGGVLLVGVDDDGNLAGLKYPEEEWLVVEKELGNCRPAIPLKHQIIRIDAKRFILQINVEASPQRPHYYTKEGAKLYFVREGDQSLRASRELVEVIRRLKSGRGVRFPYGPAEQEAIRFLDVNPGITVAEFAIRTGLNRFAASRKLIRLVAASVLRITPTEKGDIFSRA